MRVQDLLGLALFRRLPHLSYDSTNTKLKSTFPETFAMRMYDAKTSRHRNRLEYKQEYVQFDPGPFINPFVQHPEKSHGWFALFAQGATIFRAPEPYIAD